MQARASASDSPERMIMPGPDIPQSAVMFKASRTPLVQHQGPFTLHVNTPGYNVPGANDHGHGPLALVVESTLEPGTHIRLHEHTNDEIISWVPSGVMRHGDRTLGELTVDVNHLMVMNAGSGFWHEEMVLKTDPCLRMLQIFVRPHAADLRPGVQYGEIKPSVPNAWRLLFGPEGCGAPFFVRNAVQFHDIRLGKDEAADIPQALPGWDAYIYVFTGAVVTCGAQLAQAETGLIRNPAGATVTAREESVLVCFLIDPNAKFVRLGTVGR